MTAACATLPAVTDVERTSEASSTPAAPDAPAITAEALAQLTGGRLLARSDRPIRGAAVDSRKVQPGNLFVALPGERTDGHAFLPEAVRAGAAALVITRPLPDPAALGDVTVVRVADALAALGAVAAGWRRRYEPIVVGVTGSIAKTSTKEAIAAVLSRSFRTLKSEGNENNEVGLPLTVLRLGPEHQAAVLEMGMYVGGEIADLARIARPSIGVVTAVQAVHLSRIGSLEAIEAAKGELLDALPRTGTGILNADDPIVRRMGDRTSARTMTYGFADDADVRAIAVETAGADGMRFTLRTPAGERRVAIPALGRLSVHNALAGAAVGLAVGMPLDRIVEGLEAGWSAPHRVALVRLGSVTVIDDSYNASPGSMRAALELLGELPGRHVAVLGEMLELGDAHEVGHHEVGMAAAVVADLLIVVGRDAAAMADGAREAARAAARPAARIVEVADAGEALTELRARSRDGDVILVKASRGIGLDGLVDALRKDADGRAPR